MCGTSSNVSARRGISLISCGERRTAAGGGCGRRAAGAGAAEGGVFTEVTSRLVAPPTSVDGEPSKGQRDQRRRRYRRRREGGKIGSRTETGGTTMTTAEAVAAEAELTGMNFSDGMICGETNRMKQAGIWMIHMIHIIHIYICMISILRVFAHDKQGCYPLC